MLLLYSLQLTQTSDSTYRSDVHFWQHGRIGDSMVVSDEVIWLLGNVLLPSANLVIKCGSGHESAGEVVEVGEGVTEWKVGRGIYSGVLHMRC